MMKYFSLKWRNRLFYIMPPLLAMALFLSVTIKTDLSAFIVAGNNVEEILLASEMQSGSLSRRYLISVLTPHHPEESKVFIRTLQKQLKTIKGVVNVWRPGEQSQVSQTIQTVYSHYGSLMYSLNPEPDLAALFSASGLEKTAQLLKNLVLSPQRDIFKPIILEDPLLLSLKAFQSLSVQAQQVSNQSSDYQNLILETTAAGLNAPEQSRIQAQIQLHFNQLVSGQLTGYQLEMTGVPIFAVATQHLIQSDITRISLISSVTLWLLFFLIFRSFKILFQVFSLLAIVILSSILMTQLVFGYVHGMTIAIGSTLVGICIDYPIHAVAHAQSVSIQERITIIKKIWPSMVLGGMTTMIGYIALGISGYPGFQQVAVYASTGIVTSLLLTRFVFPDLLMTSRKHLLNLPGISAWIGFCQQYRGYLIWLLVGVIGISGLGLKSLVWMQDMQALTPELNYLKQNDQRIRARMTSIEPGRFVLVSGSNIESALEKAEQVYRLLEPLKQQGALVDYFGLYPWILSVQQQQHNQTLLQAYLTDENQQQWQQALAEQALSVSRLGHLSYPLKSPLTLDQVFNTAVKNIIDSRIIIGKQQILIIIWLARHQPEIVRSALTQIEGAHYFSQRELLNQMTVNYTHRAKKLLIGGLALIILLLMVRYQSLIKALQTLLPAVLSAFFILAIWSYTGVAISFLHLVGFLLVVAICVDYGIFYQENRGGNYVVTYQAMSASMLTSACAFGGLLMAESSSLRILAGVVSLGVLLGFILCPLVIKRKPANYA